MKKQLVLASASPRRSEILSVAGYDFKICVSGASEIMQGESAATLAKLNALEKAREVFSRLGGDSVVIGADTVVCHNGLVLGKPRDEADAFDMLKKLSGTTHTVISGYAVVGSEGERSGFCETVVKFKPLTDTEINAYVATKEPNDKAGAYGIQERASLFVSEIRGDYFNVMGLPVCCLYEPLKEFGILPNWQNVLG